MCLNQYEVYPRLGETYCFWFRHHPHHLSAFPCKARKKNVLVLVIGRVDFDANKKKMRAAKQIQHREKYRVPFFLHLSIKSRKFYRNRCAIVTRYTEREV